MSVLWVIADSKQDHVSRKCFVNDEKPSTRVTAVVMLPIQLLSRVDY